MDKKKCEWCGRSFFPTDKKQRFCSTECSGNSRAYNNRKALFESKSLEQIAIEAAEHNMSYGEYVSWSISDLQTWKRKRGGKQ